MNNKNDKNITSHILHLINLFKSSEARLAINYIKNHNIDPNYSEQEISDYAALWLKEPEIIKFYKDIIKIGGDPTNHHTIFQNVLKGGKFKTAEFLIENKSLEKNHENIIYIINNVTMDGSLEGLKLLKKHIDIFSYKFTHFEPQNNPTILNLSIYYNKENLLPFIFENIKDKNIYFSDETKKYLENKDVTNEFKKAFFKELINLLDLDDKKYLENKDVFENGDATVLLKVLEIDIIRKELLSNNSQNKIVSESKI